VKRVLTRKHIIYRYKSGVMFMLGSRYLLNISVQSCLFGDDE